VKPALVISDRDNVATALETLEPGRRVSIGQIQLIVRERIPHGHKVALTDIGAGQSVVKYGSPIGLASADIQAGAHVHTHNVASSRGRGDLEVLPNEPEPRLAEPSDPDPRPADPADKAADGNAAPSTQAGSLRGSGRNS
jgi:altronate dehydratase